MELTHRTHHPMHYYGDVSVGLAIGIRMTNERDSTPYEEYGYT
jgi:hypothetical protein